MALSEAPPPPDLPAGISIRQYREDDSRGVHRVIDAAFTEWPGRDPEPYEVWASMIPAHPAFRPDLSPLAFDGDEVVGAVISYDYPDAGEGWISQLATKATHRHRGIAQALLRTAFGWFRERGRTVAGVSTDSRTGALGLYEKRSGCAWYASTRATQEAPVVMAEAAGFEPARRLPTYTLSRRAPSSARAGLRRRV